MASGFEWRRAVTRSPVKLKVTGHDRFVIKRAVASWGSGPVTPVLERLAACHVVRAGIDRGTDW